MHKVVKVELAIEGEERNVTGFFPIKKCMPMLEKEELTEQK